MTRGESAGGKRERQREAERQWERQRDRERDKETERERESEREVGVTVIPRSLPHLSLCCVLALQHRAAEWEPTVTAHLTGQPQSHHAGTVLLSVRVSLHQTPPDPVFSLTVRGLTVTRGRKSASLFKFLPPVCFLVSPDDIWRRRICQLGSPGSVTLPPTFTPPFHDGCFCFRHRQLRRVSEASSGQPSPGSPRRLQCLFPSLCSLMLVLLSRCSPGSSSPRSTGSASTTPCLRTWSTGSAAARASASRLAPGDGSGAAAARTTPTATTGPNGPARSPGTPGREAGVEERGRGGSGSLWQGRQDILLSEPITGEYEWRCALARDPSPPSPPPPP